MIFWCVLKVTALAGTINIYLSIEDPKYCKTSTILLPSQYFLYIQVDQIYGWDFIKFRLISYNITQFNSHIVELNIDAFSCNISSPVEYSL